MKTCIEITKGLDTPVKLEQRSNKRFRVTCGSTVNDNLDYISALKVFGKTIFHALACLGKLDEDFNCSCPGRLVQLHTQLKTCINVVEIKVKLEQHNNRCFRVTSGYTVNDFLTHPTAVEHFGGAVFYSLARLGRLDNTGP